VITLIKTTIALSAVVFALFVSASVPEQPPWAGDGPVADHQAARRIERMTDRLDLTAKQEAELRTAMTESWGSDIRGSDEMHDRLSAILTE
jgi:Spy/CpxP family protein refolding chaperone